MHTVHDRRVRAMGSSAHVLVVGGSEAMLDLAVDRLADLEARWSRFLPTSELTLLNAADGMPVMVSADTARLVGDLCRAWLVTGGRFDPTVHDAMVANGYDRPFHELTGVRGPVGAELPGRGCADIHVDRRTGLVQLPAGVRLDPGGLGKGLAADLVTATLRRLGAEGVLVSVGGDLRVSGTPPDGDAAWRIDIEHPDDPSHVIGQVLLADGGVATSTSARRRWLATDGADATVATEVHHLLDPVTGRSAQVPRRQVTSVAGTAAWAEVAAKVTFLDGVVPDEHSAALVVDDDDRLTALGDDRWFRLPVSPN
jgi:thiamine biosynthesis lipoprotein